MCLIQTELEDISAQILNPWRHGGGNVLWTAKLHPTFHLRVCLI